MSGLLRRIRPAREDQDQATSVLPEAAPAPAPGEDEAGHPELGAPLPAGVAPEELIGAPPDTRRRGRLRRRLRHLRQVRELMLRDIGGLVYEFHRAGAGSAPGEPGAALVAHKLDRLAALDTERHGLERQLDLRRAEVVVREAGVGGACASCGEYYASDAHFCARCGRRVDGRAPTGDAPALPPAGREGEPDGGSDARVPATRSGGGAS